MATAVAITAIVLGVSLITVVLFICAARALCK